MFLRVLTISERGCGMAGHMEFSVETMQSVIAVASPDVRRWSGMREYFRESPEEGDPVIYTLYELPHSPAATDLMAVLTVLNSGKIGSEPFHTKGHFHNPDGAEYVIVFQGAGALERGSPDGTLEYSPMTPGQNILVPPGQAHRAVNTGNMPLVFVSICSPAVGHDYQSVQRLDWIHPNA